MATWTDNLYVLIPISIFIVLFVVVNLHEKASPYLKELLRKRLRQIIWFIAIIAISVKISDIYHNNYWFWREHGFNAIISIACVGLSLLLIEIILTKQE